MNLSMNNVCTCGRVAFVNLQTMAVICHERGTMALAQQYPVK